MVSDIAILNDMIKDTAKIQPEDHYGKPMVTLTEPQKPESSTNIFNLPNNAIIIKVDAFESPNTIFNCLNGECKRSDFVIIADTGNKKVIIHIEMKTTNGKKRYYIVNQLKGADCFVAYCQKIGQEFWNKPDFLDDYKTRFVSIGHTSMAKTNTRPRKQPERNKVVHDNPKEMLELSSPHHLSFKHLTGKLD